jgi:hypothetical protein
MRPVVRGIAGAQGAGAGQQVEGKVQLPFELLSETMKQQFYAQMCHGSRPLGQQY